MPIITKEVEVKLNRKSASYYKSLGYTIPTKEASKTTKRKLNQEFVYDTSQTIKVKVEDLSSGSNVRIEYLCDYCNKEIFTIVYADYTRRIKEVGKMACKHCAARKREDTCRLRYGASSYTETEEYRQRVGDTMESKYGVRHYSKTQEFKEKRHITCVSKYGESYMKQFAYKGFETFFDKTGYNFPSHSPEVREKMSQTLYKNGTTPTSMQQYYIFNIYKTIAQNIGAEIPELNYPIKYYNADICFLEEKLVVEYDGGGHNRLVKQGSLTQEEFAQKQIIRDKIIKSEGYKIIRLISDKTLLPSDSILLQILSLSREYFLKYPNHTWINFDMDASMIRNAEQQNGVFFDFGDLHKVTKLKNLQQTA